MKMVLALIAVFLGIGMKAERIDSRVVLLMAMMISAIVFLTYLRF